MKKLFIGIALSMAIGTFAADDSPFETLKKKARGGDVEAMIQVGESYEKGITGFKDYQEAMNWYNRAADKGDKNAMFKLGQCYEAKSNLSAALSWFEKAKAAGHEQAARAIVDIKKNMAGKGKTIKHSNSNSQVRNSGIRA